MERKEKIKDYGPERNEAALPIGRGLVMIFFLKDHKVLGWIHRFLWKGCPVSEMWLAEKKKRIPLFDVDSFTLPFFVEEG